jgi:hypothetical protein
MQTFSVAAAGGCIDPSHIHMHAAAHMVHDIAHHTSHNRTHAFTPIAICSCTHAWYVHGIYRPYIYSHFTLKHSHLVCDSLPPWKKYPRPWKNKSLARLPRTSWWRWKMMHVSLDFYPLQVYTITTSFHTHAKERTREKMTHVSMDSCPLQVYNHNFLFTHEQISAW